jgi:hypothetical protein
MLQRWPPHQGRSRETGDPRMRVSRNEAGLPLYQGPHLGFLPMFQKEFDVFDLGRHLREARGVARGDQIAAPASGSAAPHILPAVKGG